MNMQEVSELTIPEGEVRTIHDNNNRLLWGKLSYETKYKGDSSQTGNPSPTQQISVNTVTGTQTVTLSDGVDSSDYTINLGSIELCKIGDYQDYIYKNGDWYIHRAIGKTNLNGTESWTSQTSNTGYMYRLTLSGVASNPAAQVANLRSDYFTPANGQQIYNVTTGGYMAQLTVANYVRFNIGDTTDKLTDFKNWLSANRPVLYYALATPTDTQIADTALIAQLNAVHQFLTRYGYNATVSGNLPMIIDKTNL